MLPKLGFLGGLLLLKRLLLSNLESVAEGAKQVDAGETAVHFHILQFVVCGFADYGITLPSRPLMGQFQHGLCPNEGFSHYCGGTLLGSRIDMILVKITTISFLESVVP